jgi:hypothetical protein
LILKRQYASLASNSCHIGVIYAGGVFVYCGFMCDGRDYGSWIIWNYGDYMIQVIKMNDSWKSRGITAGSSAQY